MASEAAPTSNERVLQSHDSCRRENSFRRLRRILRLNRRLRGPGTGTPCTPVERMVRVATVVRAVEYAIRQLMMYNCSVARSDSRSHRCLLG